MMTPVVDEFSDKYVSPRLSMQQLESDASMLPVPDLDSPSLVPARCLPPADDALLFLLIFLYVAFSSHACCHRYAGKCLFVKVDADKCEALAQSFGIRAMPTFVMLAKNGDKLDEVREHFASRA